MFWQSLPSSVFQLLSHLTCSDFRSVSVAVVWMHIRAETIPFLFSGKRVWKIFQRVILETVLMTLQLCSLYGIFILFLLARINGDPSDTSVGQKSKAATRKKASIPNLFWGMRAKSPYTFSVEGKELGGWLTITWILEAVSDSCRRRRWRRRRCRAGPVGGQRRPRPGPRAVQPCPGRQLRGAGQSPRGASIPADGRRRWQRA